MPQNSVTAGQSYYANAQAYAAGKLNETQRDRIKRNMQTLEYLEGSGMTSRQKFDIRDDTVYLLIGLGGQGIKKLAAVKKQMYSDCTAESIEARVRFLAVDTAAKEVNDNEIFTASEKSPIYTGNAAAMAKKDSPVRLKWIHPDLDIHISGMTGGWGWGSDGANQCRQVGRVKLADSSNRDSLKRKIVEAILALDPGVNMQVHVIIIAGIAGGTGSGTIIDVPYIVRSVNGTNGIVLTEANFTIEGYVLLPSACGKADDKPKELAGNRNAYAALKEIDYLMTLREMHAENPEVKYQFCDITSCENIFNACTLIDGMRANGGTVGDPAELAEGIVAHTIVTSMINVTGGVGFFNNSPLFRATTGYGNIQRELQLSSTTYDRYPRESRYRFLTAGYSEVIIPIDLMKVYVANKVFERIRKDWDKAFNLPINEITAEKFLEEAHLTVRALYDDDVEKLPSGKLPDVAQRKIDSSFRNYGPFYMINMLRCIADLMTPAYIQQQEDKKPLLANRHNWGAAANLLRKYRNMLIHSQHDDFVVYTVVVEQLQKILENDAHILTETSRRKATFNENFCWEPIDLSSEDENQQIVREYLDGLLSEKEVQDFADQFRNTLIEKRAFFASLFEEDSKFDAAEEIRSFINVQLSSKVDATIEDFLVKFYAKEVDARASSDDATSQRALGDAAREIYAQLTQNAYPLVQMDLRDMPYFGNVIRSFIVPVTAPHIKAALEAQPGVNANEVYTGSAEDRFICITKYTGMPAYFLSWIKSGEQAYEYDVHMPGLHMEQNGSTENGWAEFPSLIPESRKRQMGLWNRDGRDEKLLAEVADLFAEAERYGLAVLRQEGNDAYKLRLLNLDSCKPRAGESRLAAVRRKCQEYIDASPYLFTIGPVPVNAEELQGEVHSLMEDLLANGLLVERNYRYSRQTLTPGVDMQPDQLKEYKRKLAIARLRQSLITTNQLRDTLEAVKYFEKRVQIKNERMPMAIRQKVRLEIFSQMLCCEYDPVPEKEETLPVPTGPWTCSGCGIGPLPESMTECPVCHTPKPGAVQAH